MPGRLTGHAKSYRDPVPAPPARPGRSHLLGDHELGSTGLLGGFGNRPQIRQILRHSGSRVKLVSQPLKTAGRILDLSVSVLHVLNPG